MCDEFDTNASFLFYLSALDNLINVHGSECEREARKLGIGLGGALAADFCAKNLMFSQMSGGEVVKIVPTFIKTYFSTSMALNGMRIELKNQYLRLGGRLGLVLLSELFETALKAFNEKIACEIKEDGILIIVPL